MPRPKVECGWCGREITPRRWTFYPLPHKWTEEQHKAMWPDLPYLDPWCPGGRDSVARR